MQNPGSCKLELLQDQKYNLSIYTPLIAKKRNTLPTVYNNNKKFVLTKSNLPYSSTCIPSISLIGSSKALSVFNDRREKTPAEIELYKSNSRIWWRIMGSGRILLSNHSLKTYTLLKIMLTENDSYKQSSEK
jgi:hypothetical protein